MDNRKESRVLMSIANEWGRESVYYEAIVLERNSHSFLEIRSYYDDVGFVVAERSQRYGEFSGIIATMDFGNTLESIVEMWMSNPDMSFGECYKFYSERNKVLLKTGLPRIYRGWTKHIGSEKARECQEFLDYIKEKFGKRYHAWGENRGKFDFSVTADDDTIYIVANNVSGKLAYELWKEPNQFELDNFIFNMVQMFTEDDENDGFEESYHKPHRKNIKERKYTRRARV